MMERVRRLSKTTTFLLGVFLGQVLMFPTIYWLYITPKIICEFVPFDLDNHTNTRSFSIKNVPHRFSTRTLHINIVSYAALQDINKVLGNDFDGEVAGFYLPKTHEIWSVDSVDVLIHELRHVFEGRFHR